MKKNIFLPLIFAMGFFGYQSALLSMSSFYYYNLGWNYGIDIDINANYCENNGTIAAYCNLNVKATTLKGAGSISGSRTDIQCDNYCLNGTLSGTQTCTIKAKILESSGTIEGKKVTIRCDEFKFNGTILAEECVIYTKNRFDPNLFNGIPLENIL